MKFRRQYADPQEDERLGIISSVACDPEDDLTEQHHKEETDISVMLKRMGVSPERDLPVVTISDVVKDVSALPENLQDAFDIIERGREMFAQLPHGVREYFRNDPRRFIGASEEELLASGIPGRPTAKAEAQKAEAEPPPEEGGDS